MPESNRLSPREPDAIILEGVATRYFILEKQRHYLLLQSAHAEIGANRAEIHRLHVSMANAERELDARQRRIAALETSLSWKLTAPLRRILGLFRRA